MTISNGIREQVSFRANHRCEYCLMPSIYIYAPMEIDHIKPLILSGEDAVVNLALACLRCNRFKGIQTLGTDPETEQDVYLFNPRFHLWSEHFGWAEDRATIIGLTSSGRATIAALQMNIEEALTFRKIMVSIGAYPP